MNNIIGLDAVMMIAATAMLNRKRKDLSPEDVAKREEQELMAKESLYEAQYKQAHIDHEEYKRSPRAFLRRLTKKAGEV